MKSSLKKNNDNTYSKSTLYTTLRSESSFRKTNTFNLTEQSSNKQTFITNEDNLENTKQILVNDKNTCFDLMEILQEKRKNKLTIPLKKNKIIKEKLSNTIDNLKYQIENVSSEVTKVKNLEIKINTLNKKNNSIKEVEVNLGKEYLKEIESNKNSCNELSQKIDELEEETFNTNNKYNELKNEVNIKQKNCKELSNAINQLIEDKKEINTLLILYQKKIKNIQEKIYGKLMLEKRIQSELKTIISNIDT